MTMPFSYLAFVVFAIFHIFAQESLFMVNRVYVGVFVPPVYLESKNNETKNSEKITSTTKNSERK